VKKSKHLSSLEEQLTRYLDGEMSPEEADRFEARMETDPVLQASLEGMARLGDLLRAGGRAEVSEMDFSGFWEGVESRIEWVPAESARPQGSRAGSGWWTRVKAWFWETSWRPVAVGTLVGALLLSMILPRYLVEQERDSGLFAEKDPYIQDGEIVEGELETSSGTEQDVVVASNDRVVNTDGVEVVSVSEGASVYVVNGATIIWVTDEDGGEGAAI